LLPHLTWPVAAPHASMKTKTIRCMRAIETNPLWVVQTPLEGDVPPSPIII
jgi:hypothetical protein